MYWLPLLVERGTKRTVPSHYVVGRHKREPLLSGSPKTFGKHTFWLHQAIPPSPLPSSSRPMFCCSYGGVSRGCTALLYCLVGVFAAVIQMQLDGAIYVAGDRYMPL